MDDARRNRNIKVKKVEPEIPPRRMEKEPSIRKLEKGSSKVFDRKISTRKLSITGFTDHGDKIFDQFKTAQSISSERAVEQFKLKMHARY